MPRCWTRGTGRSWRGVGTACARWLRGRLFEVFEGAGVAISLGGVVPSKARRVVETGMQVLKPFLGVVNMPHAGFGNTVPFVGEWINGPADESTRLRLALTGLSLLGG